MTVAWIFISTLALILQITNISMMISVLFQDYIEYKTRTVYDINNIFLKWHRILIWILLIFIPFSLIIVINMNIYQWYKGLPE